jgi:hypothetical protein
MPEAKPGQRFGGRQKGTPNKITGTLREAVLKAAATVGQDGEGKGGLKGYLVNIAKKDPKTYAALLGRVIPLQVGGEPGGVPIQHDVTVVFVQADKEEAAQRLRPFELSSTHLRPWARMSQALAAEMRALARRRSDSRSACLIFIAAIFRHSADVRMCGPTAAAEPVCSKRTTHWGVWRLRHNTASKSEGPRTNDQHLCGYH